MAINAKSSLGVAVTAAVTAAVVVAGSLASKFEGIRYVAYKDPVAITTVCEGHTGPDVVRGKVYSPAECAEFKRKDLLVANTTVDRCVTAPLTVGQRASLIDFAYNVGPGGKGVKDGLCYLKSGAEPTIRRLFNAGEYARACAEYPKWNAQRLPGITKRREAERLTCLS